MSSSLVDPAATAADLAAAEAARVAAGAPPLDLTSLRTATERVDRSRVKPGNEVLLNSIVAGLMAERLLPAGAILDAGANDGRWALFYASSGARTVHAVEPVRANIERIAALARGHNLTDRVRTHHGALGAREGSLRLGGDTLRHHGGGWSRDHQLSDLASRPLLPGSGGAAEPGSSGGGGEGGGGVRIPVLTIDRLFGAGLGGGAPPPDAARLAFAHLDLEGAELDALRGGARTLWRDRPLLTVELHVHLDPTHTREAHTAPRPAPPSVPTTVPHP